VKKAFCITICILIVVLMCSCKNSTAVSSENETVSQPTVSEEAVSSPQHTVESNENVSSDQSQITETSQQNPITQPEPPTSSVEEPIETPAIITQPLPQFNFTVNDAENARGLSTEKKGFSFGVARNGTPHSQSVINQQTFDAFENVDALALDTKTQEKIMYLTFDNGYEYNNLTASILDTLKDKNVKAAFFITLSYAEDNPQLVRRMINEGHIVGNHSTTHPIFPNLTRTQMAEEIGTLDNYLRANFSYTSPYFRFPTGAYSECSLELVTSLGFKSIFWSIAHVDWDTSAQKGANNAFSTVTSRFHPGAVILLHAISQDNAGALGRIIDEAHNQGYTFKTLDDYSY